LLPFLAGLIIGVLAMLVLRPVKQPSQAPAPVSSPVAEDRVQREQLKEQLSTAEARTEELKAENVALTAQLESLKTNTTASTASNESAIASAPSPANQSPFAAMFGGAGGSNQVGEAMSKMMKAAMQQQVEGKMSAMKARLHLTDDQEHKVRDILEAQYDKIGDATAKLFQGKASKDDLQRPGASAGNSDAAIKDLLTPEQQAGYDQLQVEERQNRAQMTANMELMQIQSMLQLDQSQQDRVYSAVYDLTLKQMTPAADGTGAPKDINQAFDAKVDALRPILTPDQLQNYQKFIDSQRQMVNSMMQTFGATNSTQGTAGATSVVVP
jgi:hypothetical protein